MYVFTCKTSYVRMNSMYIISKGTFTYVGTVCVQIPNNMWKRFDVNCSIVLYSTDCVT